MPDDLWNGTPREDCEAVYAWIEVEPRTRTQLVEQFPGIELETALRALWNRRMIEMSATSITAVPEGKRKGGGPLGGCR